jgi:hypothetical protein
MVTSAKAGCLARFRRLVNARREPASAIACLFRERIDGMKFRFVVVEGSPERCNLLLDPCQLAHRVTIRLLSKVISPRPQLLEVKFRHA